VSYTVNAARLAQVYGSSLQIKTRDGSDATIRIPTQPSGWPRRGTEAYGLKTELEVVRPHGPERIPAFLKLFMTEVKERETRTRLLIAMELARRSHFFHGIPFGWLGNFTINGVALIAHFTRMIHGPYDGGPEDFGRLRSNGRWKTIDADHRRRFGAELAAAVAGLERAGIVHGDISPGNTLIGQNSGKDICILCDYDGYFSKRVPRLPRKDGRLPCRPLGSPGYQYPDLISAIEADPQNDADIWVQTDRFALGVAICEMMVWSDGVEQILATAGRGELLPKDLIMSRDVSRLPTAVTDAFPEGFKLLEKAMRAGSPAAMPSPEDWLRVLGFDEAAEYKGRPLITLFRRRGNGRMRHGAFRLSNPSGDLGRADSQLAGIKFQFDAQKLELEFAPAAPVRRRREGKLADIAAGGGAVSANPGDIYYVGDWGFEVADHTAAQAPPPP